MDPNDPNSNGPYSFDFNRDMQATIGGLAYGVGNMLSLGKKGIEYLWRASKFVFRKIFDSRNITGPIKFAIKLVLGYDIFSSDDVKNSYMESVWKES